MANHIILVEPEIPQNTGNILRTCAATGSVLHLVGKLGFIMEDRYLRRAGLDYWPLAEWRQHDTLEDAAEELGRMPMFFLTTKAEKSYLQADFTKECALVFGKETKGLPEALLQRHWQQCIRIPMRQEARSLNLANSVAIVIYEALRQQGFWGLMEQGPGLSI